VLKAAEPLRDVTDAINATDASGANCHISSVGICSVLSRVGLGSVLQIAGVHGVHLMAYRREHLVGEIIEESGIWDERTGDSRSS
jgi:5,10-methylenetetrahydrofolate reductase